MDTAFAELLKGYRLAAGLTQEALAERAGLGVRSVQALERGESRPLRDTLRRLADALEEGVGFKLPEPERDVLERVIEIARAALGRQAATAAWAEGQAMSMEQAVAHALEQAAGN